MATVITFLRWTEQGVRNYTETVSRYEQARQLAEKYGVTFKDIYWTPGGPYDIVCVMESDNVDKAASFQLATEAAGNLRAKTVHAYGPDEMREIVSAGT
ncbi:GYD domain-containing protein [Saccharomonospora saliphila]|uniref:GYD domain-containing protein n=1 Tax=Saccharomonospora saliphila TaxID=369829 RepID=UPI00036D23F5|nr:GYD domain-containing protein [Saccharomonospora saliphila]